MNKIKEILTKKRILVFLAITLCMLIALFFDFKKETFDGDEIYSYTLATSPNGGFMVGNVPSNTFTSPVVYNEALTLNKADLFHFYKVYLNQANDVHPPFYYFLFNLAASFKLDYFTKWTGLSLNLMFFLVTLVFVYLISKKLTKNIYASIFITLLYGLSVGALSNETFIRMYMLSTMFGTIFIYLLLLLDDDNSKFYLYPFITVITYLGFMTHYYFLVFAFFASLFYVIYLLTKKRYKKLILFSVFTLLGVILGFITFRPAYDHMFKGYRGVESSTNLTSSNLKYNLDKMYPRFNEEAFYSDFPIVIFLFISTLVYALLKVNPKKLIKDNRYLIIILLTILSYFFLVVKMIPILSTRYIYIIYPYISIILVTFLNKYLPKKYFSLVSGLLLLLCFINLVRIKPSWSNSIPNKEKDLIYKYQAYPYICAVESDYHLIGKAPFLMKFSKSYISFDFSEDNIKDILLYLKENNINKALFDLSVLKDENKYLDLLKEDDNYVNSFKTDIGIVYEYAF